VIWPNVGFEANYEEIELQNIVMTSFQWRHRHDVTKKRHQNNVTKFFPIWAPPNQNFWLRQYDLGLGLTGLGLEKIGGLGLVT